MSTLVFDYYYGSQAEQFTFYRVPKLLIKDKRFKGLSSDAKLLYGLMLDRMSLSQKNGWFDEENRAFIHYTVENIMDDLGCAKATCTKIMAELDSKKGIGLIEKKRQGLGKPDIIYVKNFVIEEQSEDKKETDNSTEVQNLNFRKDSFQDSGSSNFENTEVQNKNSQKSEIQTSAGSNFSPVDVQKTGTNYINKNYTNQNKNNLIYQSTKSKDINGNDNDMIDETSAYIELIKENISYDHHMRFDNYPDKQMFDELFGIICEVVCVKRDYIKINGEDFPYELVKSKFLKLTDSHLGYVMDSMKKTVKHITNIRSYMITALYNAPNTMNHYYQQMVNYDMYGGGWEDKQVI